MRPIAERAAALPRLLFVSLGVPGLGGSSTAAYDLFRRLRDDGADVHFFNLIEAERAAFLELAYGPSLGNPYELDNVHTCWLAQGAAAPPELAPLIEGVDPRFLIGVGWIAARSSLRAVPQRPVLLLTGSCRSAQNWVTSGEQRDVMAVMDQLERVPNRPLPIEPGEHEVYRDCHLVLTHSAQTLHLAERFFPAFTGKIFPQPFWFAEWICDGARAGIEHSRPFEDRDIDLLFVATNWDRPEKNYPLVKALAARHRDSVVHLVGEAAKVPPSVVSHGLVADRDRLFELMGRSRAVVCPSLMDAAPGVLFEASVLGANVVASRNCGNWELCHPDLLAHPCETDAFVECIRRARIRKYQDSLDRFLHPSSYDRLVQTLVAVTRPFQARPAGEPSQRTTT